MTANLTVDSSLGCMGLLAGRYGDRIHFHQHAAHVVLDDVAARALLEWLAGEVGGVLLAKTTVILLERYAEATAAAEGQDRVYDPERRRMNDWFFGRLVKLVRQVVDGAACDSDAVKAAPAEVAAAEPDPLADAVTIDSVRAALVAMMRDADKARREQPIGFMRGVMWVSNYLSEKLLPPGSLGKYVVTGGKDSSLWLPPTLADTDVHDASPGVGWPAGADAPGFDTIEVVRLVRGVLRESLVDSRFQTPSFVAGYDQAKADVEAGVLKKLGLKAVDDAVFSIVTDHPPGSPEFKAECAEQLRRSAESAGLKGVDPPVVAKPLEKFTDAELRRALAEGMVTKLDVVTMLHDSGFGDGEISSKLDRLTRSEPTPESEFRRAEFDDYSTRGERHAAVAKWIKPSDDNGFVAVDTISCSGPYFRDMASYYKLRCSRCGHQWENTLTKVWPIASCPNCDDLADTIVGPSSPSFATKLRNAYDATRTLADYAEFVKACAAGMRVNGYGEDHIAAECRKSVGYIDMPQDMALEFDKLLVSKRGEIIDFLADGEPIRNLVAEAASVYSPSAFGTRVVDGDGGKLAVEVATGQAGGEVVCVHCGKEKAYHGIIGWCDTKPGSTNDNKFEPTSLAAPTATAVDPIGTWISVDSSLPATDEIVFLLQDKTQSDLPCIGCMRWKAGGYQWEEVDDGGGITIKRVTHWCPLPRMPE